MRPFRLITATLASVVLVAACDDPTGTILAPAPVTELAVHLTTPFSDDGAVLITLHGLSPDEPVDVTAVDASLIIHTARIADTLRIAAFGEISSGPLVQIGPLRGDAASLLGARVDDAASQGNVQRELTGYSVTLQSR